MIWCFRTNKYQRKAEKKAFLMKNGKILVEKLIAFGNGRFNPFRVVSIEELKRTTNNFHEGKIIYNGFGYRLYDGVLQDHQVSVMKFDDFFETYMYCLNNILFASQMNHKSILKLIGCCLETEIPILVFESVEYGTLADRIYRPSHPRFKPLLFTNRLKIAVEIANAIAYLHFRFSKPIIFRIIKPWNILIDEQNVAKLFDFSLSVSIPEGETHIKDAGRGIMGFVAPEYVTTRGCFNEKCDVYCFGVLLFVLLTGQRITDYWRCEKGDEFYLVYNVKKYFVNNRIKEILDPLIVGDAKEEQLEAFIDLAFKCVCISAEERPTMIDVAKQLRQMYLSNSI